jgi:O-6-methylguanine DNA methyltransferase
MGSEVLETPAGPVCVSSDGERICEIRLGVRGRAQPDAVTRKAVRQLEEYFAGRRSRFDLPLRLEAPAFTERVLKSLAEIPYGETLSYGEIAGAVGNPRAARAVGQAVGSNPLPIVLPCHRVLATRGLGGFGAGLKWKRYLLGIEGVTDQRASPASRG